MTRTGRKKANAIPYFLARRNGPELAMEDFVVDQAPRIFPFPRPSWMGGSIPIGAGRPDLVIVSYCPEVIALAHIEISQTRLLAYLRAVRLARTDTIAGRLRMTERQVKSQLDPLVEAQVVCATPEGCFALAPIWREILPEIVTVEVKVANWRKALDQARRNRIFAHRSFVALPDSLARRITEEALFPEVGIGLLAVTGDGCVEVLRPALAGRPVVWTYYYQLASLVARSRRN